MINKGSKVEYKGEVYFVEWVEVGFLGGKYLNLSRDGDGFSELFHIAEDEVTEV